MGVVGVAGSGWEWLRLGVAWCRKYNLPFTALVKSKVATLGTARLVCAPLTTIGLVATLASAANAPATAHPSPLSHPAARPAPSQRPERAASYPPGQYLSKIAAAPASLTR